MATDARVMQAADAVAAALAARLPAATVVVAFNPRYDRAALATPTIWVFPVSDREAAKLDRAADQMGPKLAVVYAERYADPADPDDQEPVPVAWVRQRVATVEAEIFDALRQERTAVVAPVLAGCWPEAAEWVTVCDPDILSQEKVFWSEVEVELAFPVVY